MIVRILGEGQWTLDDTQVAALNVLDDRLEHAVDAGDESAFEAALAELLEAVRRSGARMPDEELHESDLILPPADATVEEVRGMLTDEGLVPD